jgi:hypothetical protein
LPTLLSRDNKVGRHIGAKPDFDGGAPAGAPSLFILIKRKLPLLKTAAVRENLAKNFLLTNFAEHDTIKTHKTYHKTVGGSLPHKP